MTGAEVFEEWINGGKRDAVEHGLQPRLRLREGAMKAIHIVARRWFDRTYGNTYHSVTDVARKKDL